MTKASLLYFFLTLLTVFCRAQSRYLTTPLYSYSEFSFDRSIYYHDLSIGDSILFLQSISDISDLVVDSKNGKIYFLSNLRTILHQCDIDGGNRKVIWQGVYSSSVGGKHIAGIDYDFEQNIAFLTVNRLTINRFNEDVFYKLDLGSFELDVLKSTGQTDTEEYWGVTLDTESKFVYYGIEPYGIYQNNYDFTDEQLLLSESDVAGNYSNLKVNPTQSTLYLGGDFNLFTNSDQKQFFKINLDGSGFQIFGDTLNVNRGLIYDFDNETINCFSENNRFLAFNLSGENAVVAEDPTLGYFNNYSLEHLNVSSYENKFYIFDNHIYRRSEDTNSFDLILYGNWGEINYLHIDHDSKNFYFTNRDNHFELSQSGGEFVTDTRFFKVDSTGGNWEIFKAPEASSRAFSVVNDILFYIDAEYIDRDNSYTSRLYRYNINTQDDPELLAERANYLMGDIEINPDGSSGYFAKENIEVDWKTNIRYYLSDDGLSINQIHSDGSEVVIQIDLLDNPSLLRINEEEDKLYWVNESSMNPGLFSVNLDGTNSEQVYDDYFTYEVDLFEFAYGRANSNNLPLIADQTFSIDENTANSTLIGQILASDADGDDLTFSIISGNTNDAFALTTAGELTVQTSSELDFETTPSFSLEVEVNDGNGGTGQATVTINLNDVDESTNTNPTISAQTFSIDENTANSTLIGQIVATDDDGDNLTFSILSGNTNDAFALSTTGELTVQTSTELDYETTPTFSLEVEVNDGNGGIAQATVTVNLNDVDENVSPTIFDQTFTIDENTVNGTSIGEVVASDADGDELTYYILSGNINDAFGLSSMGELTVATSTELDFETTPTFSLEVEVNDGNGGIAQAAVTVNLNDVDENVSPTIFDQTFTVDENTVNGTSIGQVVASDADGDDLTYFILSGNINDAFGLSSMGELTVATSTELDFETTPTFSLEVEVNDGNGGIAQTTVTVNLDNVDETMLIENTFQLPENSSAGTVIGSLGSFESETELFPYLEGSTSQIDQNDEAQLRGIELINDGALEISTNNELILALNDALDFESFQSFKVTVKLCCFTAGSEPSAIITVVITNVNESTTLEPQFFSINENSIVGTIVGQIEAEDEDGDDLTFSILSGNTNNAFALSIAGELSVQNSSELDFETTPAFSLEVEVSDGNGGIAQAKITINLNDVDESTPLSIDEKVQVITFPNPSSGKMTLAVPSEMIGEIVEIFDFAGKRIQVIEVENIETSVDLSDRPDGIYLLSIGNKIVKLTKAE